MTTTVQNPPGVAAPSSSPAVPASDSTAPVLATPSASPVPLACYGAPYSTSTTLSVAASDDTAVTGVDVVWTGAYSGQASMTLTGSTWTYLFDVSTGVTRGDVTFTMTARDAAGNRSSPVAVTVFVDCVV
jgi:hypothetical protein